MYVHYTIIPVPYELMKSSTMPIWQSTWEWMGEWKIAIALPKQKTITIYEMLLNAKVIKLNVKVFPNVKKFLEQA